MNIATKNLNQLQSDKCFVDIFTDLFEASYYGFIRQFNDEFLLLEHYNDEGLFNGIIVFRREDITRIKWANNDLNSTQEIISKHDQDENIESIKIDSLETILISVSKVFKHVNINIQNIDNGMCIIGELEEMDSESIVIREFGTRSTLDRGNIMFSIEEITRIDAGGLYEKGLLKIHKNKNYANTVYSK
jgi:hypothetical protein